MSGGGTTITTGDIPPALRPLYESSINAVLGAQRGSPLSQFSSPHPQQTAQLNPLERHSIGQSYGLFNPQATSALALRDILSLPELAAAGPTTGRYQPSNLGIRSYMDFLGGPQYFGVGDDYGAQGGAASPEMMAGIADGGSPYGTAGGTDFSEFLRRKFGGG